MRVAVGLDHAGFPLREAVLSALERAGAEVLDCGTDSEESVDYPLFAARAASKVADGTADFGVVVCGSGAGVTISANKFDGVRAVNARDVEDARMARLHNDANVLALGARKVDPETAQAIVDTFFAADFEGGRHQRRVSQITDIENGTLTDPAAQPQEAL